MSDSKIKSIIEKHVDEVFKEFLENSKPEELKELNVYDFDDTLVRTAGSIYIVDTDTGEKREITPHEFHEYHLKPNEKFDLTDFGQMVEPIILPHLSKMKADYERLGASGVAICTARPYSGAVIDFIGSQGMPDIEIVAVGDPEPKKDVGKLNAMKKQKYLRKKLKQGNLKILRFFDDNKENCQAAKSLAAEFPDVAIKVEKV